MPIYKKMYKRTAILIVLAVSTPSHEQDTHPSPCPGVFEYQKPGSEKGRWEGLIHLTTDVPVYSLFLNILLDHKAELLGNSVGETTTQDNQEFRIETTELVIAPELPVDVKFFVKFDVLSKAPLLKSIKFNGKEICNAATPLVTTEKPPAPAPSIPLPSSPVLPPGSLITTKVKGPETIPEVGGGIYQPGPPIGLPTHIAGGDQSNEQAQCGKIASATTLVREGLPTKEGEWPWHVALYFTEFTDSLLICGGTLVTHQHIITAAHCVTNANSKEMRETAKFHVLLGKYDLRISNNVQFRYLSNIKIHEDYDPTNQVRDIAILTMQPRVAYSSIIQPACLWPENLTPLNYVVGHVGMVVGWGHNGITRTVPTLSKVATPVVDHYTCLKSLPWFFEKFISDYTYCAGYANGSSACNGDSGGGMVFKLGDAWHLRGLVSLSKADEENICDPNYYLVFTDVAQFLPWIKNIISDY